MSLKKLIHKKGKERKHVGSVPEVSTYKPYGGPAVAACTYDKFSTPLDRQNARRQEEAAREGKSTYLAKVRIPAHNGVKEHYAWVEKIVTYIEPNKDTNGTVD